MNGVPLVDLVASSRRSQMRVRPATRRGVRRDGVHRRAPRSRCSRRSTPAVAVGHCVGVANGTDALELALRAAGVTPGEGGHPPGQHVHRDGRGGLPHRCDPRARRRRPRPAPDRPGPGRRGRHRAHPGHRARCTCSVRSLPSSTWSGWPRRSGSRSSRTPPSRRERTATAGSPAGSGSSRQRASTPGRTSALPGTPGRSRRTTPSRPRGPRPGGARQPVEVRP